jgi:Helix-turn-helix domain/RodZ C-terminal domain
VFEIGNSLREARLRQGFELPRVEADTKIRAKYLRALEEEHFEVLPGDTYVKGFLRTYAEYLGLDGQLYVDEYNSRFSREEEFPPPQSAGPRRKPPARRMESNFVVVALAGIVAITILVVVAWKFGSSGNPTSTPLLDGAGPTTTQGGTHAGGKTQSPPAHKPRKARLVLRASGGDCWMQVRAGGASGELLYEGTLQQGQTQRFAKWKKLWLQLGAPAYVKAKLNGHAVGLPTSPAIVVVTVRGARTVSTA